MSELKYYFDIQRVGGLFRVLHDAPMTPLHETTLKLVTFYHGRHYSIIDIIWTTSQWRFIIKCGNYALFYLFSFYSSHILQQKCSLQRDSNTRVVWVAGKHADP